MDEAATVESAWQQLTRRLERDASSGNSPLLSGERRTSESRGSVSKTSTPDSTAAECQPNRSTAIATRGTRTTPPIAWPVCRMDMAKPRLARNQ